MPKLIDADELLNRLPDDLPYKASVRRVLMQAPEDVVRCADCEYCYQFKDGLLGCDLYGHKYPVMNNDYCSSGGKRDENE